MDLVDHQRLVVDRDAGDGVLDHSGELVVHDELTEIEGDARLEHPQAVDQVGACQRWKQACESLLVTGLRVTELGVALRTGHPAGQQVAARHLHHGGADQGAAPGEPTLAAASRRSMAVVELP